MTSKTTTSGGQTTESVVYTYNLRNRLARVETTPYAGGVAGGVTAVDYAYNPDGIRVGKTETTLAGTTATAYLIDPANPTGYAQVLEETTARYDAADVLLSVEQTAYVIGDDVISQTKSNCDLSTNAWTANATQYLLYDGHGSTRQLMNADLTVQDSYSYDGYGVMLGSAAGSANAAQTNLLYCGEQYDSALSQYYLRARYYNPANGLFNQLDPYAGNMQDPQSLHKYLYCHANPVNNIDPSGRITIATIAFDIALGAIMISMLLPACRGAYKQAKAIANRANCSNIFTAIFKGAVTLNDFKDILSSFRKGGRAGTINILDAVTFRQVDPLHEYRDSLWQSEGLDESWIGTASNVFAWIGTTALYSAIALWTWSALGGGTMDIAVSYTGEPGLYYHVQYGANGVWQEAFGAMGRMRIFSLEASGVEGVLFQGIPVLYPEAVMGSGYAYSCLVAALRAFGRGWGIPL